MARFNRTSEVGGNVQRPLERRGAGAVHQLPGVVVLYHLSSIGVVYMSGDAQGNDGQ